MNAVVTHKLTKRYGRHPALRDFTFHVPAATLFGFLGPNGAGKTTAIRILLGLLRATAGRAEVLGRNPWRDGPALRSQIGYLPGDVRLYDNLTGRATLRFLNAAHGRHNWGEVDRLTQLLDLNLDRRVRDYSRGMKQKLALIATCMHRPQLLILDEPTIGLDPLVREALYGELRRVVADGRTVLFSSHTLAEVDELCDEVAILRNGRLVEQERMDVLRRRALRRVELHLLPDAPLPAPVPEGLQVFQHGDDHLRGAWTGPMDGLIAWLARCPVRDVTIAPPDLDDMFLAYYADPEGEQAA